VAVNIQQSAGLVNNPNAMSGLMAAAGLQSFQNGLSNTLSGGLALQNAMSSMHGLYNYQQNIPGYNMPSWPMNQESNPVQQAPNPVTSFPNETNFFNQNNTQATGQTTSNTSPPTTNNTTANTETAGQTPSSSSSNFLQIAGFNDFSNKFQS